MTDGASSGPTSASRMGRPSWSIWRTGTSWESSHPFTKAAALTIPSRVELS